MAKLENRSIRIEDWKGNRYFPDNSFNATTAGTIGGVAGTTEGSDPYTQGVYTTDENANGGKAITLTSGTDNKIIYSATFSGMQFGKVIIGMRLKCSSTSYIDDLVKLNIYYRDSSGSTPVDTLLSTSYYDKEDINESYTVIRRVIDYTGKYVANSSLYAVLYVLPNTSTTIYFDQMYAALDAELPQKEIYVIDSTVVVE